MPRLPTISPVDLASKLQLKAGQEIRCGSLPEGLDLGFDAASGGIDDDPSSAVLIFAVDRAALDAQLRSLVDAASRDRLTWVAYPKAGQLSTDLNRDRIAECVVARGLRPVRQIALDEVWSALRLRVA
jgi:hypothetical protein